MIKLVDMRPGQTVPTALGEDFCNCKNTPFAEKDAGTRDQAKTPIGSIYGIAASDMPEHTRLSTTFFCKLCKTGVYSVIDHRIDDSEDVHLSNKCL
jgi:hypothetical protein